MERYDITIQMLGVEASGPQYVWEKVPAEEGELVLYTDAQATIAALQKEIATRDSTDSILATRIRELEARLTQRTEQVAALQARVQELEARQHFGACAKCLTNAWRICKEGTPDAVEMKCSNGSTWWLCDYCLSKEQLTQRTAERDTARRRVDELESREVDVVTLREDLEQRTAELDAAQRERDEAAKDRDDWITSWRALQRHNERIEAELERVRDQFADLRKMVAALPKVEGEIEVSSGVYNFILLKHDSGTRFLCGQIETEHTARAIAALWQHRQGMEG